MRSGPQGFFAGGLRPRHLSVLILAMCTAVFAGCRSSDPEIFVSDTASEEIISLNKVRDQGTVSGLRLHIEGELAGAAQLIVLKNGEPHHVETLTGTIDIEWKNPWTDDRVRLHYLPGPNVSGSVRIRYRFIDS